MAEEMKVLGQSAPSATTETVLYTVPAATETVVSTITVCNRHASTAATFRVGISVGGGALATTDYLYYDLPLAATVTFACTFGLTLGTADEIRVYASTANLTFQAFGTEIT